MSLSVEDVKKIATLSRLAFSEAELVDAQDKLNNVFELIRKMQATPTEGVEPMSHPQEFPLRLREDEVSVEITREAYQEIAPEVQGGLYLVPKVIE